MITLLLMMTLQAMTPMQEKLGEDWSIDRIAWDKKVEPGIPIEVHNPYGDVRSRGAEDGVLAISAMVQSHKDDKHKLEFDIREGKDKIVVNVIYKGDEALTYKKNGKRRSDVTVYVPHGCPYTVSTFKGYLEAKGLKGDLDASSDRGKIFARFSGHLKAKTRQGDIHAVIKSNKWTRPMELESALGTITIQLPANAGGTAIATTRGEITTDYSINIKKVADSRQKTGTVKLGEGKQEIRLTNQQGNIKILQGFWEVE